MAKNVKNPLIKPSSELHFIAQTPYLIIDKDVTLLLQLSYEIASVRTQCRTFECT